MNEENGSRPAPAVNEENDSRPAPAVNERAREPKSTSGDVRIARWVATIAGLLGFVLAVATPLLPVTQTTATLNWPQQGQVGNVTAPLISQAPVSLTASVPCEVIRTLPADGGLVLGTAPARGPGRGAERDADQRHARRAGA